MPEHDLEQLDLLRIREEVLDHRIPNEWITNDTVINYLRIAIILLFLGLAAWAIILNHFRLVIAGSEPWLFLTDVLINVAPELAGIVIGFVTIDYLNDWRQREYLKAQLIRQMGMNIRDVAVPAARELAYHGWCFMLRKVDLREAALSRADLTYFFLIGADLTGADLSGTNLTAATLRGADLTNANLQGADLSYADLSGAILRQTNLRGANLERADLSNLLLDKADLSGANLCGTNLSGSLIYETNLSEVLLGKIDESESDMGKAILKGRILGESSLRGPSSLRVENLVELFLAKAEANFSGAVLGAVNLSEAKGWTLEQLEKAKYLTESIMPDGIELVTHMATFKDWKEHYLTKHGGTDTDLRDEATNVRADNQ
jgi:uncharacterized protein YjbI with pentapeptide repeats